MAVEVVGAIEATDPSRWTVRIVPEERFLTCTLAAQGPNASHTIKIQTTTMYLDSPYGHVSSMIQVVVIWRMAVTFIISLRFSVDDLVTA